MIIGGDYLANLPVLKGIEAQMQQESWHNTFWAKVAGFPDNRINKNNGQQIIGMPVMNKVVQVWENLNTEEGRDSARIPFNLKYFPTWVYGDEQLIGTGKEQVLNYIDAYINQARAAIQAKSGNMSNQRIKIMDMIMRARPQMLESITDEENAMGFQAIYEGTGGNITKGTVNGGIGLKKRFHPNWYLAASGGTSITALGTEGSTKTPAQLDTAYNACSTASGSGTINAKLLDALEVKAKRLRIPPVTSKMGFPYYILLMSPEDHRVLKQDDTYKASVREAYSTKKLDAPELHSMNVVGFYGMFAIVEDFIGARGWDKTNQSFAYAGAENENVGWKEPSDSSLENSNLIILGQHTMFVNRPVGWNFTDEFTDHRNLHELGVNAILGYNRPDWTSTSNFDTLFNRNNSAVAEAAATPTINQSSMIVMVRKAS